MGSTGKILGAEPYMSTASQWGHPRSIAFPVKPFLFVAIDLSWVICHLTIWFVFYMVEHPDFFSKNNSHASILQVFPLLC